MSQNYNLESVVEKLIHQHFELDESLEDVEIAWQQEVQRRVDEVEQGEVVCLLWEQVL